MKILGQQVGLQLPAASLPAEGTGGAPAVRLLPAQQLWQQQMLDAAMQCLLSLAD